MLRSQLVWVPDNTRSLKGTDRQVRSGGQRDMSRMWLATRESVTAAVAGIWQTVPGSWLL